MNRLRHRLQSDEALMLACRSGDSEAFEQLYLRHKDRLFAHLYRSCPRDEVTAEVARASWVAVMAAAPHFPADTPFRVWLYRLARLQMAAFWQHPGDREETLEQIMREPVAAGDPCMSNVQTRQLMTALCALPAGQREALLLGEQGFSLQEIASITARDDDRSNGAGGTDDGAHREITARQLHDARSQLQESIGSQAEDAEIAREPLPLPDPSSPLPLDQTILSHARTQLPVQPARLRPLWLGGLTVAAAAIALAVLLPRLSVLPQLSVPPAADSLPGDATLPAGSGSPPLYATLDGEEAAAAEPRFQTGKAGAATEFEAATTSDSWRGSTPPQPGTLSLSSLPAGVRAPPTLSADELTGSINTCLDVLEQGDSRTAQECYENLCALCGDCGLPGHIDELAALARQ